MKKQTKRQRSTAAKQEFFENYTAIIIERLFPDVKIFPHFIKVEVNGIEYDYYPGGEMKLSEGYGRINNCTKIPNVWSDLSHKDFLALLQIDLNNDVFSTREEDIVLNELGIFKSDQI